MSHSVHRLSNQNVYRPKLFLANTQGFAEFFFRVRELGLTRKDRPEVLQRLGNGKILTWKFSSDLESTKLGLLGLLALALGGKSHRQVTQALSNFEFAYSG